MKICCKAPGKIIWFGEHFVVKGIPAVASSVDLYVRTYVEPCKDGKIRFWSKSLEKGFVYGEKEPDEELLPFKRILDLISERYGSLPNMKITIDSDIPISYGLGSSAASSISFAAAVLKYIGVEPMPELVKELSMEAEKIVHGKPSGIDTAISLHGSFIYYLGPHDIRPLNARWNEEYTLLVIGTGITRSTGLVVKKVLERYERFPNIMNKIYEAASEISATAKTLMINGEWDRVGELMNINHGLLVSIGVAIPETERIIHNSLRLGALGAKISGAGMGGIVIVLLRKKNRDTIINGVASLSNEIIEVKPGIPGLECSVKD